MVAVCDVTDARADAKLKDDLLQRNQVLLREIRHRVANSLQIIASVLLQHARKIGSDEAKTHLRDAHNRVMSVAALERQLSASDGGEVELQAYFTDLCKSISASMIAEPAHLSLTTAGAAGAVDARLSVSLGLIVTELVINALKHAFSDAGQGRIVVDWELRGPNWSVSVTDDGVGMPTDPAQVHEGLGTSIVRALAKQLHATVEITPAHPGARVTVAHTQIALVGSPAEPAPETPAFPHPARQDRAPRSGD